MAEPPRRRFTLADIAILVAASGVGAWGWRRYHAAAPTTPGTPRSFTVYWIGSEGAPWLLATTLGLLACRFLISSLKRDEILKRPGTAGLVAFALTWAFTLPKLYRFSWQFFSPVVTTGGLAVAVTWALMALNGSWRRPADWIDLAGLIAVLPAVVFWIAVAFAF